MLSYFSNKTNVSIGIIVRTVTRVGTQDDQQHYDKLRGGISQQVCSKQQITYDTYSKCICINPGTVTRSNKVKQRISDGLLLVLRFSLWFLC